MKNERLEAALTWCESNNLEQLPGFDRLKYWLLDIQSQAKRREASPRQNLGGIQAIPNDLLNNKGGDNRK